MSTGPDLAEPLVPAPSIRSGAGHERWARWRTGWQTKAREAAHTLANWPWLDTLRTLRERFREDRLSLAASSLTFTTFIALVPLVTVMLAVFSAFPMFSSFQGALEKYFLEAALPEGIAKPVLRSLTQFAGKARGMGTLGLLLLVATALALVLTIDRTLNNLWRVRRPRPIGHRVLLYWAVLTLGPLLLGVSLSITSYAISANKGVVAALPGGVSFLLNSVEFALVVAVAAGLFHYVPHTFVRWRHALAGGVFVAFGLEAAKGFLAWYVQAVPSFSMVYGAFATLPILLLWVYLVWVIVLLGAVVAAYAPALQGGLRLPPSTAGARFDLALALLRELRASQQQPRPGLSLESLSARLHIDPLQLEPLLALLAQWGWAGRLEEPGEARHVLLVDVVTTVAAPLVHQLLLQPGPANAAFREVAGLERLRLAQLLD
jgi:membrane protein